MRLCVSAILLLALTRARADPIPGSDECSKLDQLRTITDKNEVEGRFYFMAAYANNDITSSFLKVTNNFWGDMTVTKDGLYVDEYSNMNGTCMEFRSHIRFHGDVAKSSLGDMSSEFRLHNFTRTLFIMDLNTTMKNTNQMLKSLHLDPSLNQGQDTVTTHCYYLISREQEVSDADLQLFKDRAKCAGFTGEPAFVQKSNEDYCSEWGSTLYNTDPECINLNKLDEITDKTQVAGTFYFMAAYTDNEIFQNLIKLSSSIKGEISVSEDGYHVQEFSRMNGTCLEFNLNVTQSGAVNKAGMDGLKTEMKFRSFSSTSKVMSVRMSSPDIMPLLQKLHIDPSVTDGHSKIKGRGLYLISNGPEVNDVDLQLFRKYAKCGYFPDEPAFLNKGNADYCSKEGSISVH